MKFSDFPHLGVDLGGLKHEVIPTGSRFNCIPPVLNTDEDYLVWAPRRIDLDLLFAGYSTAIAPVSQKSNQTTAADSIPKNNGVDDTRFVSWRKGDINLIVTEHEEFFNKHKIAGYVCKRLNLTDKKDRILVYHAILYGEFNAEEPIFRKKTDIDYFEINKMCSNW